MCIRHGQTGDADAEGSSAKETDTEEGFVEDACMLTHQQRLKADSMLDIIISLHADGVNVFHTHSQMLVGLANVGIVPPKQRAIKPSGDVKDRRTLAKRAREWSESSGNDVAGQMAKMLHKDPHLFQKVINSKLLSVSLDKHFGAVAAAKLMQAKKLSVLQGLGVFVIMNLSQAKYLLLSTMMPHMPPLNQVLIRMKELQPLLVDVLVPETLAEKLAHAAEAAAELVTDKVAESAAILVLESGGDADAAQEVGGLAGSSAAAILTAGGSEAAAKLVGKVAGHTACSVLAAGGDVATAIHVAEGAQKAVAASLASGSSAAQAQAHGAEAATTIASARQKAAQARQASSQAAKATAVVVTALIAAANQAMQLLASAQATGTDTTDVFEAASAAVAASAAASATQRQASATNAAAAASEAAATAAAEKQRLTKGEQLRKIGYAVHPDDIASMLQEFGEHLHELDPAAKRLVVEWGSDNFGVTRWSGGKTVHYEQFVMKPLYPHAASQSTSNMRPLALVQSKETLAAVSAICTIVFKGFKTSVTVKDKTIPVHFILSCDGKFGCLVMQHQGSCSKYFCLWCTISKQELDAAMAQGKYAPARKAATAVSRVWAQSKLQSAMPQPTSVPLQADVHFSVPPILQQQQTTLSLHHSPLVSTELALPTAVPLLAQSDQPPPAISSGSAIAPAPISVTALSQSRNLAKKMSDAASAALGAVIHLRTPEAMQKIGKNVAPYCDHDGDNALVVNTKKLIKEMNSPLGMEISSKVQAATLAGNHKGGPTLQIILNEVNTYRLSLMGEALGPHCSIDRYRFELLHSRINIVNALIDYAALLYHQLEIALLKSWVELMREQGLKRPPTGYAGQECIDILERKKEILHPLRNHPLCPVVFRVWGLLDIMMHIIHTKQLDHLSPRLINIFAQAASQYEMYSSKFLHQKFPPNNTIRYAFMSANAVSTSISVRLYEHCFMHHFDQMFAEVDLSIAQAASQWVENGNQVVKECLKSHTSLGGGHPTGSSGTDELRQACHRLNVKAHPLIAAQVPAVVAYKCTQCRQLKKNTIAHTS